MVFKSNKKSVFNVGAGLAELYDRAPARPPTTPSIITAEMVVTGDLQSPGDVQIEGRVIGQIKVNRLILAEGAAVTGDIIAKEVRICGTLRGTVSSSLVTLTQTGRVIGDIFHELLSIETGGQLEGRCHRLGSTGETATPAASAAPSASPSAEPARGFAAALDSVLAEPELGAAAKPLEAMPRIYANGRNRNAAA
jgi:cytoskeletal protein CcmA (bactofilin family)